VSVVSISVFSFQLSAFRFQLSVVEENQSKKTERPFGVDWGVPTYIYETTDPTKPIRNFEVKQSVHDEPLQSDPETGEPARRIISLGYSVLIRGKSVGPSVGSVGQH
jgi:predicted nucleic acid-binding Zn ribbon protein